MLSNERSPLYRSEFYFQFQKINVVLTTAPKLSIKLKANNVFFYKAVRGYSTLKTLSTFNKIIIDQWETTSPWTELSARQADPIYLPLT